MGNITGSGNTAVGDSALAGGPSGGASGSNNTALGGNALFLYSSGSNNIAVGFEAGYGVTTGSNNIEIGNEGAASDSGVIRIGTEGAQTGAAIAGIYGVNVTGMEVVINSKGKLGVKTSARRFKDDIQTIGESSERLYQLQPVTFRYKEPEPDGARPIQYGLVAEEVAKVYPELVERDGKGVLVGVHYDELAPMLLNEVKQLDTPPRPAPPA